MQRRLASFKADPLATLRRFQDYLMEAKVLRTRAQETKYAEKFLEDIDKHIRKLDKVTKTLDKVATNMSAANDNELPSLLGILDLLVKEHSGLNEWGQKFGMMPSPTKGNQRKAL